MRLMKYILLALALLLTPAALAQKDDARHFWMSAWVLAKNQCLDSKGLFASKETAKFNLQESMKKHGYDSIDADNPYVALFAAEIQMTDNSLSQYCLFPLPDEGQVHYWFKAYYNDELRLGDE